MNVSIRVSQSKIDHTSVGIFRRITKPMELSRLNGDSFGEVTRDMLVRETREF